MQNLYRWRGHIDTAKGLQSLGIGKSDTAERLVWPFEPIDTTQYHTLYGLAELMLENGPQANDARLWARIIENMPLDVWRRWTGRSH